MTNRKPSDQLIVALDVPTVLEAAGIVENLGDAVSFYKIGYQLAFSGGLQLRRRTRSRRQARLSRHETARHRQHRRQGRRGDREDRRLDADRFTPIPRPWPPPSRRPPARACACSASPC
jgi:hypothetical protein